MSLCPSIYELIIISVTHARKVALVGTKQENFVMSADVKGAPKAVARSYGLWVLLLAASNSVSELGCCCWQQATVTLSLGAVAGSKQQCL